MLKKGLFMILMLVSCMLVGSTTVFAENTLSQSSGKIVFGDVNGDDAVNSIDYALVASYLAGAIEKFPAENGMLAADVNLDSGVTSADLALVKQFIVQTIAVFPADVITGQWIPYTPPKESITYRIEQNSAGKYQVVFSVAFPSSGYEVEYTDQLAVALGVLPDGSTLTSYIPVKQPAFWEYSGNSLTVITSKSLRYTLGDEGKYTFNLLGNWYNFTIE